VPQRTRYTADFKNETARRIIEGESVDQVAVELGLTAGTIRRWVREVKVATEVAPRGITPVSKPSTVKRVQDASATLLVIFLGLGTILGPFIINNVIPDLAYRWAEFCAFVGFGIGVLVIILAMVPRARVTAGLTLVASSYAVGTFLWVWSVLIVGHAWGIGALYFVNFFLLIGSVLAAFAVLLLSGAWDAFWQLAVIAFIVFVFRILGLALVGDSSE
jgi:hypothetical protein